MTLGLQTPNRWRVERAGDSTRGYAAGWFAVTYDGLTGAWFPTWAEAQAFADSQSRARSREAWRRILPILTTGAAA